MLGLVLDNPIEAVAPPDSQHVLTRPLRWDELASFAEHPAHDELAAYIAWKRKHSHL